MKTFTVKEDTNLKNFTDETYPQGSFCFATLLKNRDIKINGARADSAKTPLFCGDEVTYYTTEKQESMPTHQVVYEDENIIVCDKYSGVSYEGLLNSLCGALGVHRLDRNTQGLIIFAKNVQAQEELLSAFDSRRVLKTYLALCKNNFKEEGAVYSAYLKKNSAASTVKVYGKDTAGAVKIKTGFQVLQKRGDIALVRVTLYTGKTHQIRAHAAYLGCPVLGDTKYGDGALNKKYGKTRQQLISKTLAFCFTQKLAYLNGKQFISKFKL